MTALLAESYSRAYVSFVMTQQLSELEEIIEYKLLLKQTGLPRKSSGSVGSASSLSQLDTGFANTGGTYRQRGAQGEKCITVLYLLCDDMACRRCYNIPPEFGGKLT